MGNRVREREGEIKRIPVFKVLLNLYVLSNYIHTHTHITTYTSFCHGIDTQPVENLE